MNRSLLPFCGKESLLRFSILITLFVISTALSGQKPADFSGTWTEDNSKGNYMLKGYKMILTISQTDKTISIKWSFFNDKGKEEDSQLWSYNLDGKEVVKKESGWVEKQSVKLSTDKKEISVKTLQILEDQVVEAYDIYSLSENGQVITLKRFNIQAKDKPNISLFNRNK
jgi:hypothetical protein